MARQYKILLVDDEKDILDSLQMILEGEGYSIRTARNGEEALARLKEDMPDLMFLDIMMTTDTEGFDLAFKLRAMPEYKSLPIVLLTGFLEKVRKEGPDLYQHIMGEQWPAKWMFEKPIDPKKLLAKVRELLP